ncbi:hypothetical protein [Actinoplanes sp. NPDC051494]|uniref:hypothetical protein n=1 Tax=Actinoplanes sp. NPDC051494 TaxID=3363907 RepID=UPI00379A6EB5
MAITHIEVLVTALAALIVLSRRATAVTRPEGATLRRAWDREQRRDAADYGHLNRRLGNGGAWTRPPRPDPGIDQIAADLRRLGRERFCGLCTGSARWHAAVLLAYDNRLQVASQALGVTQRLAGLRGMDRELERMRVEEELRAAGLRIR